MKKVKHIWFVPHDERKEGMSLFFTGLIVELEDGRMYEQQSSDHVRPFEEAATWVYRERPRLSSELKAKEGDK